MDFALVYENGRCVDLDLGKETEFYKMFFEHSSES